ncbi:MAG TPA: acetyl-coenzyme A synthetase N-terminal domain-containing protein, partial [Solirubrobacteraceae bacterium]|nr:acetyl-coenzyme A synthetase N-terminal domain-containing protein [Solirubrobacteraceae bacterium]
MASASEQTPLWQPTQADRERAEMTRFMRWVGERRGHDFENYDDLWRWSVAEVEGFWASIWEFCEVRSSKTFERPLAERTMPGARWFEGAELNYAENLLAGHDPGETAVLHCSELRELGELSWGELSAQVAAAAAGLR